MKGNCGAVTELVDVISLIACGFVTVVKVIVPRVYHTEMNVIVNSAINDWKTVNNKRYRLIMLKYAYIGRVVFIVQMIGAYAAGFPLIISKLPFIMVLWSNDRNDSASMHTVPIGPSCWVSSDISMFHYIFYYIFQSIQLLVVCTAYIGADTYFFGIAMHVCGQFALLSHSLDNIYSNGDIVIQKHELSLFIKRHKHLLLLANNFEETYNLIILSQVAIDTLLICISGIVLLMTMHTRDLVVIVGLIIRIYLVKGADPHVSAKHNQSVLYYAICNENYEIINYLLEHGAGVNYYDDDYAYVELLVSYGADVHHNGLAVKTAVVKGDLETIQFFIDYNFDVNTRNAHFYDKDRKAPLNFAIDEKSIDIIEFLLINGADIWEKYTEEKIIRSNDDTHMVFFVGKHVRRMKILKDYAGDLEHIKLNASENKLPKLLPYYDDDKDDSSKNDDDDDEDDGEINKLNYFNLNN
ncbi:hypothetical protein KQX54_013072 [Cotesia glomerata]|uniref:Odorant receptor n=1 Tax=Cotesia glomerata TaxID=32391 RepID=A0AAV7ISB6_COTGL|nr:hypothetical protein KQX54_013072 [Cotesia glomerata]